MILKKAEIVGHLDKTGKRHAIYSIDFQPNGSRLATCGGDCTVKIWGVNSLLGCTEQVKESLLATLTTHSKPVNIVRWSMDGRFLASGSDDNYILIHRYAPGGFGNQSFGSTSNVKNVENWIRCCTLQGHTMDIMDLDWSSNGLLASGSVDNTIVLWDVGGALATSRSIIAPFRILNGHKSFVKGVSFDPMGRYLASCGSDNRILIWESSACSRTVSGGVTSVPGGGIASEQWVVVKELASPMKNMPDKSMFRRMSWSPDGHTLCVSSCLKSGKPVAMVLRRESWESAADLVGHNVSTVCCRFCPYVLSVPPNLIAAAATTEMMDVAVPVVRDSAGVSEVSEAVEASLPPSSPPSSASHQSTPDSRRTIDHPASKVCCMMALGDQAGVVSLWGSHSSTALLVLKGVFSRRSGAVSDISWVRSGTDAHKQLFLACCSVDGSVVLVDLSSEPFAPLSNTAMDQHCRDLYCNSKNSNNNAASTITISPMSRMALSQPTAQIPRSAPISSACPSGGASISAAFDGGFAGGNSNFSVGASNSGLAAPQQQQSTVRKDGKKRIQPVLLQQPSFDGGNPFAPDDSVRLVRGTSCSLSGAAQSSAAAESGNTITSQLSSSAVSVVGAKRLRFADEVQSSSGSGGSGSEAVVVHDLSALVRKKGSAPPNRQPAIGTGSTYAVSTTVLQSERGLSRNNLLNSYSNGFGFSHHTTPALFNSHGSNGSRTNGINGSSNGPVAGKKARRKGTPKVTINRFLTVRLSDDKAVSTLQPLLLSNNSAGGRSLEHALGRHKVNVQRVSAVSSSDSEDGASTYLAAAAEASSSVQLLLSEQTAGEIKVPAVWSVDIVGVPTCVSGFAADTSSCADVALGEGVVVVGTHDGGLHLLSVPRSGAYLTRGGSLVLGSAVAFVDVAQQQQVQEEVSCAIAAPRALRVLACTLTGDLQVWTLSTSTSTSTSRFNTGSDVCCMVKSQFRASLRPLLTSIRSRHNLRSELLTSAGKTAISTSRAGGASEGIAESPAAQPTPADSATADSQSTAAAVGSTATGAKTCESTAVFSLTVKVVSCAFVAGEVAVSLQITNSTTINHRETYTYCEESEAWVRRST